MDFYLYLYVLVLPGCCLASGSFQFQKDRPVPTGRIIGGQEVTPHSYPFMAGLVMFFKDSNLQAFCGGTLINDRYVLTAAHCFEDAPEYIMVILGAHNVKVSEATQLVLKTTGYVVHEHFSKDTLQNDVALVRLPQNVTFNKYISTVVYQNNSQNDAQLTGTIVGWGLTEYSSKDLPNGLRKVDGRILSNDQCKAVDPFQEIIVSTHMCLDGTGPVGGCNGDSGGPLLVGKLQVGIVSFGYNSCTAGKPSVFTRVTEFHDWIEKHSKGHSITFDVTILLALVLFGLCSF